MIKNSGEKGKIDSSNNLKQKQEQMVSHGVLMVPSKIKRLKILGAIKERTMGDLIDEGIDYLLKKYGG